MDYEFSEDIDYGIVAEPQQALQINRDLNMARRIIEETGANLFLTGKAGTGKTTFLRRLVETSAKRMIVLAPTGVAAINAGGMTIHSFFQFPFSPFVPGVGFPEEKKYYRFSEEKKKIIRSLDLLVIDEISMVRADLLDGIDDFLRRIKDPTRPFGGIQLLMIGDLRQLAPIINPSEKAVLANHYTTPFFFDSIALKKAGFLTIELLTIYRQSDEHFIEILNGIRDGNVSTQLLCELNSRYRPQFRPADEEGYIHLTTHNSLADDINGRKFEALSSAPHTFTAKIEGKFPEGSFPAPLQTKLKTGAQVIFIKNDNGPERRYYNGMTAIVTDMSDDTVTVRPIGTETEIEVGMAKWENISYKVDPESKQIKQTIEGSFHQIPLKLAWAITIHKSQGLTFDRAIIDASRSFASGQAYVALSRCRSLEGLVLSSPIPPDAVMTDKNVNDFIDRTRESRPDIKTLDTLRSRYYQTLVAEVFQFRPLLTAFDDFKKAVDEYLGPIHNEYYRLYRDARQRIQEKILDVGNRFASLYATRPVDPDAEETGSFLGNKISGGAAYFLPELHALGSLVVSTDMKIGNAKYAERLRRTLEAFSEIMEMKIYILSRLANERFTPARYISLKSEALIEFTVKGGVYSKKVENTAQRKPAVRKRGAAKSVRKEPKVLSYLQSIEMLCGGMTPERIAKERSLAITTVASHLEEGIREARIGLGDVIDQTSLKKLRGFQLQAKTREEFRAIAMESGEVAVWKIYLFSRHALPD